MINKRIQQKYIYIGMKKKKQLVLVLQEQVYTTLNFTTLQNYGNNF